MSPQNEDGSEYIDQETAQALAARVDDLNNDLNQARQLAGRIYNRLQASDVPRGPWHGEISSWMAPVTKAAQKYGRRLLPCVVEGCGRERVNQHFCQHHIDLWNLPG
jgi:hypothetical protein